MTEAHPAAADQADLVETVEVAETTTTATTVTPARIVTSYAKCARKISNSTEDKWKCWISSKASRTPTVAEGDPEKSPRHHWLGIKQ